MIRRLNVHIAFVLGMGTGLAVARGSALAALGLFVVAVGVDVLANAPDTEDPNEGLA